MPAISPLPTSTHALAAFPLCEDLHSFVKHSLRTWTTFGHSFGPPGPFFGFICAAQWRAVRPAAVPSGRRRRHRRERVGSGQVRSGQVRNRSRGGGPDRVCRRAPKRQVRGVGPRRQIRGARSEAPDSALKVRSAGFGARGPEPRLRAPRRKAGSEAGVSQRQARRSKLEAPRSKDRSGGAGAKATCEARLVRGAGSGPRCGGARVEVGPPLCEKPTTAARPAPRRP